MVWKQDLAKLKQAYKEAGGPPPPPLPVKPKPKPVEVKELVDEDAVFLAAMGGRAPKPVLAQVAEPPPAPFLMPSAGAEDISFEAGLADLRGFKPMTRNPVLAPPPVKATAPEPPPPQVEVAEALPVDEPLPDPAPGLAPESDRAPFRIQLAAGMAVEVDATLDLRHHSVPDALGRLRDRLEDGAMMGWRTLHVILGEDERLHQALLAFLSEGSSKASRYAQAPIPMGGAQAWVLYY